MDVDTGTRRSWLGILLILVLVVACDDDTPGPVDPADQEFAAELGVDLDAMTLTESGLYLLDEVEGEGPVVEAGDSISVHYWGWLPDGRMFDASELHGGPFEVRIGVGRLIAGWEEGIPGMREAGERLLVIPAELAYGPQPILGVPWANLVFRVELVDLFDEEEDEEEEDGEGNGEA